MGNSVKSTLIFKMVSEQAMETSIKLQTKVYVVYNGKSLRTTLLPQSEKVLAVWENGNQIKK